MGFSKEFLNSLPHDEFVPANERMAQLLEATAEDGTLHLFAPYEFESTSVLSCKMNWDVRDLEKVAAEVYGLNASLKALAQHHEALDAEGADPAAILQNPALLAVYNTYLLPLDTGDFDMDRVYALQDQLNAYEERLRMNEQAAYGDTSAAEFIEEFQLNKCQPLNQEEHGYLVSYYHHLQEMATQRVGQGYQAHNVTIGARRLYRLYSLGAPELICSAELTNFATLLILHHYASDLECFPLTYAEEQLIDRPTE